MGKRTGPRVNPQLGDSSGVQLSRVRQIVNRRHTRGLAKKSRRRTVTNAGGAITYRFSVISSEQQSFGTIPGPQTVAPIAATIAAPAKQTIKLVQAPVVVPQTNAPILLPANLIGGATARQVQVTFAPTALPELLVVAPWIVLNQSTTAPTVLPELLTGARVPVVAGAGIPPMGGATAAVVVKPHAICDAEIPSPPWAFASGFWTPTQAYVPDSNEFNTLGVLPVGDATDDDLEIFFFPTTPWGTPRWWPPGGSMATKLDYDFDLYIKNADILPPVKLIRVPNTSVANWASLQTMAANGITSDFAAAAAAETKVVATDKNTGTTYTAPYSTLVLSLSDRGNEVVFVYNNRITWHDELRSLGEKQIHVERVDGATARVNITNKADPNLVKYPSQHYYEVLPEDVGLPDTGGDVWVNVIITNKNGFRQADSKVHMFVPPKPAPVQARKMPQDKAFGVISMSPIEANDYLGPGRLSYVQDTDLTYSMITETWANGATTPAATHQENGALMSPPTPLRAGNGVHVYLLQAVGSDGSVVAQYRFEAFRMDCPRLPHLPAANGMRCDGKPITFIFTDEVTWPKDNFPNYTWTMNLTYPDGGTTKVNLNVIPVFPHLPPGITTINITGTNVHGRTPISTGDFTIFTPTP